MFDLSFNHIIVGRGIIVRMIVKYVRYVLARKFSPSLSNSFVALFIYKEVVSGIIKYLFTSRDHPFPNLDMLQVL